MEYIFENVGYIYITFNNIIFKTSHYITKHSIVLKKVH